MGVLIVVGFFFFCFGGQGLCTPLRHPPLLQRMDEELPVASAETGSYSTAS